MKGGDIFYHFLKHIKTFNSLNKITLIVIFDGYLATDKRLTGVQCATVLHGFDHWREPEFVFRCCVITPRI